MTMETVDRMVMGRRSLFAGSAALAGLWSWPCLSHPLRLRDSEVDAESSASDEGVQVVHCGHIALVVSNFPSQANVLNEKRYADLLAAFRTADEDESILSIVLVGRGAHFSKGIDGPPSQVETILASAGAVRESNRLSTKTIIAALHGQIAGLAVALPLCADVRIASADAVFSWPDPSHAKVLRPRLIDEIGRANAQRFLLTGRSLDAREAWRLGFVQDIAADPADALEKAVAIAEAIAQRTVEARDLA
jgi:enoyl-CoA hydratase